MQNNKFSIYLLKIVLFGWQLFYFDSNKIYWSIWDYSKKIEHLFMFLSSY